MTLLLKQGKGTVMRGTLLRPQHDINKERVIIEGNDTQQRLLLGRRLQRSKTVGGGRGCYLSGDTRQTISYYVYLARDMQYLKLELHEKIKPVGLSTTQFGIILQVLQRSMISEYLEMMSNQKLAPPF